MMLKDADLITISIGGNNILNSVLKNLNIDKELIKNYNEEEFDSIISKHLNSENIKNEILNEIKSMIQEEEAKEIGLDIIKKYVVSVPIWANKGRCMNDLKIK